MHGLADGIFWSGVFAFVSASINAIKTGVNNYASRQKELVEEYIKKYAKNTKDAEQIYNSFEGKIKIKTSRGLKAHRYYDGNNAFEKGRYLTTKPTAYPIKDLVLKNNAATKHIVLEIAKGKQYLVGKIAGSPVKAVQIFVGQVSWLLP